MKTEKMKPARHLDKSRQYRNDAGALFIKDADSMEGYYHFCDWIQEKYMPHIWKHDCHAWIYLGEESHYIHYCPLCGKSMD